MSRRAGFSGENLSLTDIAYHHSDTEQALRRYFSGSTVSLDPRFVGYPPAEVLRIRLDEHDYSSSLTILASLEAAFRVDYIARGQGDRRAGKNGVSRKFRELYRDKERRVSLEDDILNVWRNFSKIDPKLIEDLKGALKYRHWLAHGRYWTPKLPRKYDYLGIYILADEVFNTFDLL